MPLNAVNFVPNTGQIKAADMLQFYNLFTGAMTDQPVTFPNLLAVGGGHAATQVPLKVNGVTLQSAALLELRAASGDANPVFSVDVTGNLHWGVGGATGVDTLLGRTGVGALTFQGTFVVNDANGHAVFQTSSGSAAAVNSIQVKNAATTFSPEIDAVGTDTNIAVVLRGKGTAGVIVPSGGLTVTAGGLAVTAGGLTLTAGGALGNWDFTGATTVKGVPMLNLLTNPGFEIWQRPGASFTTSGTWTADRWFLGLAGSDTMTITKVTSSLAPTSGACAQCVFVLNGGAGGSNVTQFIKAADGPNPAGVTFSFSMRVKTTTAGAVKVGIVSDGTGGTTTLSGFAAGTGAWETLTVTATAPADATFIRVGAFFFASATVSLDNATLVADSVPMDYLPLHPADDLARCMRYYQRFTPGQAGGAIANGQAYVGTNALHVLALAGRMGGVPTLAVSAMSDWQVLNANAAGLPVTAMSIHSYSNLASSGTVTLVTTVASGLVAGNAASLTASNTTGWISLEWNP